MKKIVMQAVCLCVVGLLPAFLFAFFPVVPSALRAGGSLPQRLQADNVTTTGKVLAVGPSTVSSVPIRVLYAYDAPGYPRNGNAGSFQREQPIAPEEAGRFGVGMLVKVEYSRAVAGMSRLQGHGTGSVFVKEQLQDFKQIAFTLVPIMTLGVLLSVFLKRRQGLA